jgi:Gpi18-like mannosyltransferase
MTLRVKRFDVQVALSVLLLYGALWPFEAPDLPGFYYVWLSIIEIAGPIDAFARPFSNYTPPYLYLLALSSLLGLPQLAAIKLIAIISSAFAAFSVHQLVQTFHLGSSREAGLLALLIPSLVINGPLLGQCDGLWVGCCILATASAVRGRPYAMAVWAGLGFAIKAQALFLAPFCLAMVLKRPACGALVIPPLVYLIAVAPAWAAGWPLGDLLTIYVRQSGELPWLSTAPNLWAPLAYLHPISPAWLTWSASLATLAAALVFIVRHPRDPLLASLIVVVLMPWLLPKMHERYFLLADLLALALVARDRTTWPIFVAIQLGSLCSLLAYILSSQLLNVVGFLPMSVGLGLLLIRARSEFDEQPVAAKEENAHQRGDRNGIRTFI